jgi:hypothetical protein
MIKLIKDIFDILNNRQKIRDSKRIYMRKRRSEDPLFKLKDSIIGLIYHSIKRQGYKKDRTSIRYEKKCKI